MCAIFYGRGSFCDGLFFVLFRVSISPIQLVRTSSGRQRFNILGAYNPLTHLMESISNTTYINSDTVCKMLRKLAKKHAGQKIKIVLDKAAYQRCKKVTTIAESLNIELLFLPTYSPNLNLIERYWKFLKKQCLYNHYYENFNHFKNAINKCIKNNKKNQNTLKKIMTLKFQSFEKYQMRT
jgi:transposase